MKTTIFVFHPYLNNGSKVNYSLANAAKDADIEVRNMYDIYSNNDIDVNEEKRILEKTDKIVIQFPMFWYSSPSLLKKWEDVVLEHGWAYGSNGDALKNKELILAVSPGASGDNYVHNKNFKYKVTDLLRPFQATSNLIGTKFIKPFITTGASSLTDDEINSKAKKYVEYVKSNNHEILGDYE
ncbi:NAD(P)H-dependent oxidoreductase [Apilactobacillus quenuiae]|uniref:NAD(P)H-dependent oxidoreductase n=1 Tax=Apilactobacillus quenuiae TaxID=2008377 RepID=UPI000D017DEB|nr:NAD(P)H-dependent oxidoreductase [Apilactobacillus quenuiae]